MADERRANPSYSEDVDLMMLEYLIYSTTKACMDDFMAKSRSDAVVQPSQEVLTQVHILNDFYRIYKAKYLARELDAEIRLWLELLELAVLISYRRANSPLLHVAQESTGTPGTEAETSPSKLRRQYWISVREKMTQATSHEDHIYESWRPLPARSYCRGGPRPAALLSTISPLFFTVTARIASFAVQGVSEMWMDLAAELLLQTAMESCMSSPSAGQKSGNALMMAFAWGWIPSQHWDEYEADNGDRGLDEEKLVNELFEEEGEQGIRENQYWRKTRLNCLSLFDLAEHHPPLSNAMHAELLEGIAKDHPIQDFEVKAVLFLRELWILFRKPLLVQIEEGEVEGMTEVEFADFKKRVFLPQ